MGPGRSERDDQPKPALPSDDGPASGYEYHVRVSPTDLEDLRAGRVDSLSSHLPHDVGPIERVRITFGEGPAPRERTAAADRRSKAPATDRGSATSSPSRPRPSGAPRPNATWRIRTRTRRRSSRASPKRPRRWAIDQQQAEEWARAGQQMADAAVDSGVQLAQAYVAPAPNGDDPYGITSPSQGREHQQQLRRDERLRCKPNGHAPLAHAAGVSPTNGAPNYTGTTPYNTNGAPNYSSTNTFSTPTNGASGSTQLPLPPPPGHDHADPALDDEQRLRDQPVQHRHDA